MLDPCLSTGKRAGQAVEVFEIKNDQLDETPLASYACSFPSCQDVHLGLHPHTQSHVHTSLRRRRSTEIKTHTQTHTL